MICQCIFYIWSFNIEFMRNIRPTLSSADPKMLNQKLCIWLFIIIVLRHNEEIQYHASFNNDTDIVSVVLINLNPGPGSSPHGAIVKVPQGGQNYHVDILSKCSAPIGCQKYRHTITSVRLTTEVVNSSIIECSNI